MSEPTAADRQADRLQAMSDSRSAARNYKPWHRLQYNAC